ncbi:MAG: alanine--tRNA ligase [Actinomycetota bacterium]|nr:alanine--tRNA ligase [Actinomycetota bacterium]
MDSRTIRDRFFAFFASRDHTRVPSSSLVPNDPSLLLTNAGMNQFKPYFLGEQSSPYQRAMSIQKCFRATDIDEVGRTSRHLTFFEMLGNFSFGDYFKERACPWAWELVTEGFGIDPELLWVTVYETDDEAADIWRDGVKVAPDRVLPWDKKENFWSMGVAGPCGPCSEIYADRGERFGPASDVGPQGNAERYVEIWNLVFMQNDCNAALEPIGELPTKNIDTGAGLERLAIVLQDADSIYDTDTLGGMLRTAGELTRKNYGDDDRTDMALRVLADHGRSLTFLIGDGVLPSNEERGYVLRRVMRRAVRHARMMGRTEPILPALVDATVGFMGDAYPELAEQRDFIIDVAAREEERFDATLKQGTTMLESEIRNAASAGSSTLSGEIAFRLHDTWGFPIDITNELAEEAGLEVDTAAFEGLMTQQRQRARAARAGGGDQPAAEALLPLAEERGPTEFLGYEHLFTSGEVIGIVDGASSRPVASAGDEVDLVMDRTVFYAQGGGQVGDRGVIRFAGGSATVTETRPLAAGLTGHRVVVEAGAIALGDEVQIAVDPAWRRGSERAHTATHILHWVLRDRLGEHARQAGSLVEPGRLRFDFNHYEGLGVSQVQDIGAEVLERAFLDDVVRAYETSFDFARSVGAMAIFGEKYGDFVRVVEVGEYSKELCGGTHVAHTSQIGVSVVTAEGSVGANLRRIEMLVGKEGVDYLAKRLAVLERAADSLKVPPDDVAERVERLMATHKDMERRLAVIERRSEDTDAAELAQEAVDLDGTKLLVARRDLGVDALRSLAQKVKGRLGSGVVVLGTSGDGRANLVGAVTKDLIQKGVSARDLLAPGAALLGGGGGGKPELAISGGPNHTRLEEAIEAVRRAAQEALSG